MLPVTCVHASPTGLRPRASSPRAPGFVPAVQRQGEDFCNRVSANDNAQHAGCNVAEPTEGNPYTGYTVRTVRVLRCSTHASSFVASHKTTLSPMRASGLACAPARAPRPCRPRVLAFSHAATVAPPLASHRPEDATSLPQKALTSAAGFSVRPSVAERDTFSPHVRIVFGAGRLPAVVNELAG